MALQFSCERLVDLEDLNCECDLPDDFDQVNDILDGASDFLSQLAGFSLGRCAATYRPCRDYFCRQEMCSCCGLAGIHLPGIAPTVTSVWLDGALLPTDQYKVMISPAGRYVLVRLTAAGKATIWPGCHDKISARTVPGTFEITVESGYNRSFLMTAAAAEIACDAFAALVNGDHVLPAGSVTANAFNLTVGFLRFGDPTDQETLDLAGLVMVNRFLNTLPEARGTEILAPELDDGWELWQHA